MKLWAKLHHGWHSQHRCLSQALGNLNFVGDHVGYKAKVAYELRRAVAYASYTRKILIVVWLTKQGLFPRLETASVSLTLWMEGVLSICPPTVHGHASEGKRVLPPAGLTAVVWDTCSGFSGYMFTGLALLQSSYPSHLCLAFVSTTVIHFLFIPFLLDGTHDTNFSARHSFSAKIEVFNRVCSICSPSTTPEYRQ